MQKLDTIQKRGNLNEVYRIDEPGPGGAYHKYQIRGDTPYGTNLEHISFQKGPRSDREAQHGVLDCDLLEIVRDRLKCFQEGEYACQENDHALLFVEEALKWLNQRVENRIARGVLGKEEK